jgi:hypothetical protein
MTAPSIHDAGIPAGNPAWLIRNRSASEKPLEDTAWSVLDAANDVGDDLTVDACRRVIDANLRGHVPAPSDLTVISAFFS